jgi:hypothetical protein
MIAYWAVPFLLLAAPPMILLLSIVLGGCTVMRTAGHPADQARSYSDPGNRAGAELIKELDRREARTELRRIIEETQR